MVTNRLLIPQEFVKRYINDFFSVHGAFLLLCGSDKNSVIPLRRNATESESEESFCSVLCLF